MKFINTNIKKKKKYDRLPPDVVRDFRLTPNALRLYIIMCNAKTLTDKNGKAFEPTTKVLASMFGVDERTVKRWLHELKYYGYIKTRGTIQNLIIDVQEKGNNKAKLE